MFQSLKRAAFISRNDFQSVMFGSGTKMHLWLQKAGWPANEFVDLFMRAHPKFDPVFDGSSFKLFMIYQSQWAYHEDIEALKNLSAFIDSPRYREMDTFGLVEWTLKMAKEAESR